MMTIVLLAGCRTDDNPINRKNTIEEIFSSSYTARCEARVLTDKTENEYIYTCSRFDDGSCRIDYGDMIVHISESGAELQSEAGSISTGAISGEAALVPSYFFNEYLKGGTMSENEDGYLLECTIENGSAYRGEAVMTLSRELIPEEMCIKDKNGSAVIHITITDFKPAE